MKTSVAVVNRMKEDRKTEVTVVGPRDAGMERISFSTPATQLGCEEVTTKHDSGTSNQGEYASLVTRRLSHSGGEVIVWFPAHSEFR